MLQRKQAGLSVTLCHRGERGTGYLLYQVISALHDAYIIHLTYSLESTNLSSHMADDCSKSNLHWHWQWTEVWTRVTNTQSQQYCEACL